MDVWQDRDIKFDIPIGEFALRPGEVVIDSINSVEDTKGNNGIRGSLAVTNLRLQWCSHKTNKINLSIGLNTISKLKIKNAKSKLRGVTQALYIMSMYEGTKYEFIFTSLVNASPRLFTTVQAIYRAYETSRLYRELKLRGAIVKDYSLKTLPDEEIYEKVEGVWNLSSDQGNLGTFYVTNIRIVWFANLANNFNVSIPFMQIQSLKVKTHPKFGKTFVVATSAREGGYILGFRIDPVEKLEATFATVEKLYNLFVKAPSFGVSFSYDEAPKSLQQVTEKRIEEDVDIIEEYDEFVPTSFNRSHEAYITSNPTKDNNQNDDEGEAKNGSDEPSADEAVLPEYNVDLGVACQKLPKGVTKLSSLWSLSG